MYVYCVCAKMTCMPTNVKFTHKKAKTLIVRHHRGPRSTSVNCTSLYIKHSGYHVILESGRGIKQTFKYTHLYIGSKCT